MGLLKLYSYVYFSLTMGKSTKCHGMPNIYLYKKSQKREDISTSTASDVARKNPIGKSEPPDNPSPVGASESKLQNNNPHDGG